MWYLNKKKKKWSFLTCVYNVICLMWCENSLTYCTFLLSNLVVDLLENMPSLKCMCICELSYNIILKKK